MFLENILYGIMEYVYRGGVVMIPLLFICFILWTFIIERLIFFKKFYSQDIDKESMLDILRYNKNIDKLQQGIKSILTLEIVNISKKGIITPDIVDEAVLRIVHRLDTRLKIISLLSSIAPLLGLLGTTIGMVKTFFAIAVFGTGNVKSLASGISEALITTQTGLFIAIPGIYMSNFLNQRAMRLKKRVSKTGMYIRSVFKKGMIC